MGWSEAGSVSKCNGARNRLKTGRESAKFANARLCRVLDIPHIDSTKLMKTLVDNIVGFSKLHTSWRCTGTTESITSRSNTAHYDRTLRAVSRETETERREEFERSNHLCPCMYVCSCFILMYKTVVCCKYGGL